MLGRDAVLDPVAEQHDLGVPVVHAPSDVLVDREEVALQLLGLRVDERRHRRLVRIVSGSSTPWAGGAGHPRSRREQTPQQNQSIEKTKDKRRK